MTTNEGNAVREMLETLEVLVGHAAHYASMPHAASSAHRDVAKAYAVIRKYEGPGRAPVVVQSATDKRALAAKLLLEAAEIDGLRQYTVECVLHHGNSVDVVWSDREPTEEEACQMLGIELGHGDVVYVNELAGPINCGADFFRPEEPAEAPVPGGG